jgi:hypothetical protein
LGALHFLFVTTHAAQHATLHIHHASRRSRHLALSMKALDPLTFFQARNVCVARLRIISRQQHCQHHDLAQVYDSVNCYD